jgi:MerR family transcriptional regulator, light-induced transcriptional regulator
MHPLYSEFISTLDSLDKEKGLQLVLGKLDSRELDIVTLYNEILTPAQYEDLAKKAKEGNCIWQEHIRTSIVRTIIECCYPYVIRERDHKYVSAWKGKVVVVCPPEELHEIGARMVADYFTLCGFRVLFIGANTPQNDILNGIQYLRPEYVAVSVTSYFNLLATKNAIRKIMDLRDTLSFQVILGGQACRSNPAACNQTGADMILESFEDIRSLSERQK